MPSEAPYRLSLTEYSGSALGVRAASEATGIPIEDVRRLLSSTNDRLVEILRLAGSPIRVRGDSVRVEDVAGLIRVAPLLELEVAPKFLGAEWPEWRGDFFVVATLSRYGRLLASDRLRAGFRERGDLATLVGRAIVDLYWDSHRRPLRTYKRQVWRDFWIDGDVEAEEISLRDPDGFAQHRTVLARTNPYNQIIHAAAGELLPEIRDAPTRRQLLRVREALAPQASLLPRGRPTRVPTRHRRWQPLYDLSTQVLSGFGVDLGETVQRMAPGYVLKMAKAWEDLISIALRVGLPTATVRAQQGWKLGKRNGVEFRTTPDVTARIGKTVVLVDAKYKARAEQAPKQVSSPDVYEGLAFLRAANAKTLALLYPLSHREAAPAPQPGAVSQFERIEVGEQQILAYEVECRGIARRNGFRDFATRLAATVASLA